MALGESLSFDVTTNASRSKAEFDELAKRLDALDAKIKGLDENTVNITVDRSDVERVEADIEQAKESLEQLEEPVRVRVDVDERGNAGQAADNIRRMNVEAEGLQRGIGPLRGFTDELGASSAAGGVAANAMIDLGEAVEVFGGQMGLSQKALQNVSLALGGVGLAIGVGLAAWQKYKSGQEEARVETERTTEAIKDQLGFLDEQAKRFAETAAESVDPFRQLAATIFETFDDKAIARVNAALAELGLTVEDLPRLIRGIETDPIETFAAQLEALGIDPAKARDVAEFINAFDGMPEELGFAAKTFGLSADELSGVLRPTVEAMFALKGAAGDLQIDAAITEVLAAVAAGGGIAADALVKVREALPNASDIEVYEALLIKLQQIEDATGGALTDIGTGFDRGKAVVEGFTDAIDGVTSSALTAAGAVASILTPLDQISNRLNEEQALIGIVEQFQRVLSSSSDQGTESALDQRKELISLAERVLAYARTIEGVDEEKVTNLIAAIDDGNLIEIQRRLDDLTSDRTISLRFDVQDPNAPIQFKLTPNGAPIIVGAGGSAAGVANSGGWTPPGGSGTTVSDLLAFIAGQQPMSVTNNYFGEPTTEQVAAASREYQFRNGPVLLS